MFELLTEGTVGNLQITLENLFTNTIYKPNMGKTYL